MWVNGMSGTGYLRKPLETRQQLNISTSYITDHLSFISDVEATLFTLTSTEEKCFPHNRSIIDY